jgi:hypothetical protein
MFSRVSAIYQKIIHIYCWLYRIVIYICKVNKAQNKKNINKMETLDQILDSKEFNEMFDFEAEKREVEEAGWNYADLIKFAQFLATKK